MTEKTKSIPCMFRISQELKEKAERDALDNGLSFSNYIRLLIANGGKKQQSSWVEYIPGKDGELIKVIR